MMIKPSIFAIAAFMAMRVAAHAEPHHEITDTELAECYHWATTQVIHFGAQNPQKA
jgi:hypothetical protein